MELRLCPTSYWLAAMRAAQADESLHRHPRAVGRAVVPAAHEMMAVKAAGLAEISAGPLGFSDLHYNLANKKAVENWRRLAA